MNADALGVMADAAARAVPSLALGLVRCLAILLLSMALARWIRSARASHAILAAGLLPLPIVLALSFAPGIPITFPRERVAPALDSALTRHVAPSAPLAAASPGGAAGMDSASTASPVDAIRVVPLAIFVAWLAGWLIATSRVFVGHLAAAALVRTAPPACDNDLVRIVEQERIRFAISRRVRIVLPDVTTAAFTHGTFRPVICIPRHMLAVGADRIVLVVRHELAHVRRLDTLATGAARLACALFWFLPPAWIALRWLGRERESACDDLVLRFTPAPAAYAETLVLAAHSARSRLPAVIASGATALERRVRRILRPRTGKEHLMLQGHRTILAAMAVMIGTIALVRCSPSGAATPTTDTDVPPAAMAGPVPVFSWPLKDGKGIVTTHFGPSISPFTGQNGTHRGIDIAWTSGHPVLAAADGIVEVIDFNGVSGLSMIVTHSGTFHSGYEHLERTKVFIGDHVSRGQEIGSLGSTGAVTGPHLHFELFLGGAAVDPLTHLTGVPAYARGETREPGISADAPSSDTAAPAFSWPLPRQRGSITQEFGWAIYPFEPARGQGYMHEGIDIADVTGTPVLAAADGVVAHMGYDRQAGAFIQLSHVGGWSTRYEHLSAFEVAAGQLVTRGQRIGYLGNTGLSTGPHLHFTVLEGEQTYHDPLRYLSGVPPRVLLTPTAP